MRTQDRIASGDEMAEKELNDLYGLKVTIHIDTYRHLQTLTDTYRHLQSQEFTMMALETLRRR